MSDVVIASNITTKVNRAISGATTVNANCYAVVNYHKTAFNFTGSGGIEYGIMNTDVITRYFGPSQSIPATFNSTNTYAANFATQTYSLLSGVEFINSP
jgi:hypothetical protein